MSLNIIEEKIGFFKRGLLFVNDKGQILHLHSQMPLLLSESACSLVQHWFKQACYFSSLQGPRVCTAHFPASICVGGELSSEGFQS